MTDIEISNNAKKIPIKEVAKNLGFNESDIELFGNYKAKINDFKYNPKGKLVLVTAINPTSAGEGKTTLSIGLADGLKELNKNVCLTLREPSLGPVFGVKGGATGGGYSQIVPMEDINLHFTGDFHAVTVANNLLCSFIDNHIFQGNLLNINPDKIVFNRCMDLNDRALREIVVSNGAKNGVPRKDNFIITAASEIMAILCLSKDINDLKKRLGDILIGFSFDDKPIFARDLKADGAMAILLKDAIKPNLVQTLIGTPALIHGGPFANIAHGCNSIIATKIALSHADYVITEAGFGADLGAEKFFDTKCRVGDLKPNAVVIVATVRALKLHGGAEKDSLNTENLVALKNGMPNLFKHIENIKNVYHLPVVVAINKFSTDTDEEIKLVENEVKEAGSKAVFCDVWAKGGKGAINLAKEVISLCEQDNSEFDFCYELNDTIENKIFKIANKIYGAKRVVFEDKAKEDLEKINKLGFSNLPVIIAKTQYSLSDDQKLFNRPQNFDITIKSLQLRSGAKFIVALAGDILLMPGLSKNPAGSKMDINDNFVITGLF